MNANTVSCIAVVVFVTFCASLSGVAGTKCYSCTSSNPLCLENVFVSVGISTPSDCTCCTKTVDSDGTKRECQSSLLETVNCIPTSTRHVCTSDLCNGANTVRRPGLVLLTAAAVLVLPVVALFAR